MLQDTIEEKHEINVQKAKQSIDIKERLKEQHLQYQVKKMKEFDDKSNRQAIKKEQHQQEFKLEIDIKHEHESLAKMDRVKLKEQDKRRQQYRKEIILQKELNHTLTSYN